MLNGLACAKSLSGDEAVASWERSEENLGGVRVERKVRPWKIMGLGRPGLEFNHVTFRISDVAPGDLATIRGLEGDNIADLMTTGLEDGLTGKRDIIDRKGNMAETWPIDGCCGTGFEYIVMKDF